MKSFISIILLGAISYTLYISSTRNHSFYAQTDFTPLLEEAPAERFAQTLQQLLNDCVAANDLQAPYSLANFLLTLGHPSEAVAVFKHIQQIDQQSYTAVMGIAIGLDQLGYLDESISHYQSAIKLSTDPTEQIENTHRIGELYLRLNRVADAKGIFRSLNYAPSLVDLCRIYVHENNWQDAHSVFSKLVHNDPENKSLEIQQLNSLAKRHFNKHFTNLPASNERKLLYSQHIQLALQKRLTQQIFSYSGGEMYQAEIATLPVLTQNQVTPSNQTLFELRGNTKLINDGQTIFTNNNCVICHGEHAQGATGPNLRDQHWIIELTPLNIFKTIKYGRNNNTMPAFHHLLSDEQIIALSVFIMHANSTDSALDNPKGPQGTQQLLDQEVNK